MRIFIGTGLLIVLVSLAAVRASQTASKTVPLPTAAQAAVNRARQARAAALAAYRLSLRRADRAEFVALKLAERKTMRHGTLAQAEAIHAEIARVQKRFGRESAPSRAAPVDRSILGPWANNGSTVVLRPNHSATLVRPGKRSMRGQWYMLTRGKFVEVWEPTNQYPKGAFDLCQMRTGKKFQDSGGSFYGTWTVRR